MLKPQLILLLSLLCFLLRAQEKGYLITPTDSVSYNIKFQEKHNKTSLFFRRAFQDSWNEIYASNAESAGISGKVLYLSLYLPDEDGKVWVKCIFDGKYQLVNYKNDFYVVNSGHIIKLTSPEKAESKSKFIGEMISLFSSEISFDFRMLKYYPKSLVKPFVQYHEAKSLPYNDYNRYPESASYWNFVVGLSSTGYDFYPERGRALRITGFDYELGVKWVTDVPAISNRLFFSMGLAGAYSTANNSVSSSFNDKTFYHSIIYKGFRVGAPVLVEYNLPLNKKVSATMGTGIKVSRDFMQEDGLITETVSNNVVHTEIDKLRINSDLYFQHINELNIKIAGWDKFQFGLSYSYLIQKKSPSINLMQPCYSLSVFTRFIL